MSDRFSITSTIRHKIGRKQHRRKGTIADSFDPDALAYLLALEQEGPVSVAETAAVLDTFTALKSAGIWNKIERLYLVSPSSFPGSFICAKTLNVADKSETDDLSWDQNGWYFIGIEQGGGEAWIDTNFVPSGSATVLTATSNFQSCYFIDFLTSQIDERAFFGFVGSVPPESRMALGFYRELDLTYTLQGQTGDPSSWATYNDFTSPSANFVSANRDGVSSNTIYYRSTVVGSESKVSDYELSTESYLIGNQSKTTTGEFTGYITTFLLAASLTSTEINAWNAIVEDYNTQLGRWFL